VYLGKTLRTAAVIFVLAVGLVVLTRAIWLPWWGEYLVENDPPERADVAVVLAGDYSGNRITRAAELVKGGYAPKVLVSGPAGAYGVHESDLAIPYIVKKGYPAGWFIPADHEETSTLSEGQFLVQRIRGMHAHKVLLVTSDFHTRRAGRIFRRLAPDLRFVVVSAPTVSFQPRSWWHTREGRKTLFMEWSKTVAYAVGL
jgi:uncharacterized SAM-binding protein YcdF (DUF218 family)